MVEGSRRVTKPIATMLAVIRCGDNSLHESWALETRHCDIGISYFGSDDARLFPEARYVHRKKAGKWDGIYDFFESYPQTVNQYDYFWFPDDDLHLSGKDVDALIAIGKEYQLDLLQPCLDRKSYFTHYITLNHPQTKLRFTNFVEIMAPMLSSRLFHKALPTIATTRSGFGLDFLWAQMVADMRGDQAGCAIIDQIAIHHTRPVGSALKGFMAKQGGNSGRDEFALVLQTVRKRNPLIRSLGLSVPRKRVFSIASLGGDVIHSRLCILWRLLRMFAFGPRNTVQPTRRWRATLYALTASF
jgi:hypothetical protein